jgi:hypothetical protein
MRHPGRAEKMTKALSAGGTGTNHGTPPRHSTTHYQAEDHAAEMDALVQQLVTAGLLEIFTDDDGDEAMRLTPEGEKVARQLALGADEDTLLEALLGE